MFLAWRPWAAEALLAACLCGAAASAAPPAMRPPVVRPVVPSGPSPAAQAVAGNVGSAEDVAAAAAFVQAYYAAMNAADLDAVIRLWSREMPSRGPLVAALVHQFDRARPVFSDLQIARTIVTGDRARLTIRATMQVTPLASTAPRSQATPGAPAPAGPDRPAPASVPPGATATTPSVPPPATTMRTVFILSRDAGIWRLYEEKSPTQDLSDRLMEAEDDAAADRLAAEEIHEASGAAAAVTRALLAASGTAMSQARYADALRAGDRAQRLAEAARARGAGPSALFDGLIADVWSSRAFVHLYKRPTPEPERALEPLARALAIYEATGDATRIAATQQAMGTAAYSLGDYAGALAYWERALVRHQVADDAASIVRAQLGIGNVRYLFAELDAARRAYDEALALSASAPDMNVDARRALQGLGRVAVSMGDYAGGRERHVQALARLDASASPDERASALMEIGRTDFLRGRLDEARAQYVQALAIEEQTKDRAGQGDVFQALALVEVLNADTDAAIAAYTRSAAAYMQASERREADIGVGHALLGRASVWLDLRDAARALADFTESLARFDAARDIEGAARARLGLAMTHIVDRRADAALAAAERAIAEANRVDLPDVRWQAQLEAGRARLLAGARDKAKAAFDGAVVTMEESRLEAVRDARMPARRAAPHAALAEWHIAGGDAVGALLAADAGKGRVLEDLLQPFRARLAGGIAPARAAEETRLIGRRVSLLAQMRHERQRPSPDATRLATLQQALQEARAATDIWQREVAHDAPRVPFARGEARLTSLDALETTLADDAALIQFVSSDDHLSVIVATARVDAGRANPAAPDGDVTAIVDAAIRARDPRAREQRAQTEAEPEAQDRKPSRLDVRAYTRDITRADLARRVWRFADALARGVPAGEAPEEERRALFELLLGPARAQLDGRAMLIVVPDDVLWLLPFEALDTAGAGPQPPRYLTEQAAITYLPSVATWLARPTSDAAASPSTAASSPAPSPPSAAASPAISPATAGSRVPVSRFRFAAADIVDISPLQSTIALAPDGADDAASAPMPATAADWLSRSVAADLAIVWDVTQSPERLRLDVGRLGMVAVAWSLATAGVPRTLVVRRALDPATRARVTCDVTDALGRSSLPDDVAGAARASIAAARTDRARSDPRHWAVWLPIGPPPAR